MATMNEVMNNNYSLFNRFNSDKRQELIQSVEYINSVASDTATPIKDWDITSIFGIRSEGTNELIIDRREINRRFWAKADEVRAERPPAANVEDLGADIQERLSTVANRQAANVKASLENSIASHLRAHNDYAGRAQRELASMAAQRLELAGISNEPLNLTGEVTAILSNGFYTLQPERCRGDIISFTTPNIVCDYNERNEATPPAVDMGMYLVEFNIAENRLSVRGFSRNRNKDGYLHPFLSGGGICWGNQSNLIGEHLRHYRWSAVFGLLETLLTKYDANSSPYMPLEEFINTTPSPERDPNEPIGACSCGSTDTIEDSDNNGVFFVCNSCGNSWD